MKIARPLALGGMAPQRLLVGSSTPATMTNGVQYSGDGFAQVVEVGGHFGMNRTENLLPDGQRLLLEAFGLREMALHLAKEGKVWPRRDDLSRMFSAAGPALAAL
jgi:hypothetical protein